MQTSSNVVEQKAWMFVSAFDPSCVVQQVKNRNDITLDVLIIVGSRTALLLFWRTQPESQPAVHHLR